MPSRIVSSHLLHLGANWEAEARLIVTILLQQLRVHPIPALPAIGPQGQRGSLDPESPWLLPLWSQHPAWGGSLPHRAPLHQPQILRFP